MKLKFKRRKAGTRQDGDEAVFARLIHKLKGSSADEPTLTIGPAGAGKPEVLVFQGSGAHIVALLNKYHFVVAAEKPGDVLVMVVTWFGATNEGQKRLAKAGLKGAIKKGVKMGAKAGAAAATGGASEAYDAAEAAKDAAKLGKAALKAMKGETEIGRNNLQTEWELRIELVECAPEMSDALSGPVHRTRTIGGESDSGQIALHMLNLLGQYAIAASSNAPQAVKDGYIQLLDIEDAIKEAAEQDKKNNTHKDGRIRKGLDWLAAVRRRKGYQKIEDEDDDIANGPVALEEEPAAV